MSRRRAPAFCGPAVSGKRRGKLPSPGAPSWNSALLVRSCNRGYTSLRAQFSPPDRGSHVNDRKTILVIDDYETSAAGWGLYLHNAKYSVETAYGPEEGLQLFAIRPIDLVLLDYAMPAIDGGQVAATMKHMKPSVPILMLSGLPCRFQNRTLRISTHLFRKVKNL